MGLSGEQIPPEIWSDPSRNGIGTDLSEFGRNDWNLEFGKNLVGMIPSLSDIWVGSHQDNIPTIILLATWIPAIQGRMCGAQ